MRPRSEGPESETGGAGGRDVAGTGQRATVRSKQTEKALRLVIRNTLAGPVREWELRLVGLALLEAYHRKTAWQAARAIGRAEGRRRLSARAEGISEEESSMRKEEGTRLSKAVRWSFMAKTGAITPLMERVRRRSWAEGEAQVPEGMASIPGISKRMQKEGEVLRLRTAAPPKKEFHGGRTVFDLPEVCQDAIDDWRQLVAGLMASALKLTEVEAEVRIRAEAGDARTEVLRLCSSIREDIPIPWEAAISWLTTGYGKAAPTARI